MHMCAITNRRGAGAPTLSPGQVLCGPPPAVEDSTASLAQDHQGQAGSPGHLLETSTALGAGGDMEQQSSMAAFHCGSEQIVRCGKG